MAAPTQGSAPDPGAPNANTTWESFSTDTVQAAGLQSVNVDVEADATIQTESNSSS